ncbi:MAG: hypothetical protein KDE58_04515, partial [Caldilineaceae bacterium]|nr:hypothetical protein [Caldilineaceae bacterium]
MAEQTEQQTQPFFSRELSAEEAQLLSNTVRRVVADDMSIESVQTTRDQRQGAVIVHGRLHKPSHEVFTRWLQELNALGYTPVLRHRDEKSGPIDGRSVMLQVFAGVAPK